MFLEPSIFALALNVPCDASKRFITASDRNCSHSENGASALFTVRAILFVAVRFR